MAEYFRANTYHIHYPKYLLIWCQILQILPFFHMFPAFQPEFLHFSQKLLRSRSRWWSEKLELSFSFSSAIFFLSRNKIIGWLHEINMSSHSTHFKRERTEHKIIFIDTFTRLYCAIVPPLHQGNQIQVRGQDHIHMSPVAFYFLERQVVNVFVPNSVRFNRIVLWICRMRWITKQNSL